MIYVTRRALGGKITVTPTHDGRGVKLCTSWSVIKHTNLAALLLIRRTRQTSSVDEKRALNTNSLKHWCFSGAALQSLRRIKVCVPGFRPLCACAVKIETKTMKNVRIQFSMEIIELYEETVATRHIVEYTLRSFV